MAITQNTFNGDGSNLGPFSFTFKWLEPTDIKVTVSGVLKTAGTHYNLQSLNYATKSGGQVLFTAGNAPAVGTGNIVVYRQTDDSDLSATFNSGSAIRAQDLNDNFTQGLYVTQEANNNVITANATANAATATANTALSNSTAAVSTANTASSNASAAVATANTASSNASAAVSTANTASSNATTAVNTANAATATANSAASDAATAISTANSAVSTANTASTNATNAVNTANAASSAASSAVSTANAAASDAAAAVSTANTASSNATTAVNTANTAISTANAAASAVANAILYDIVANVAAIPGSPANNDAVEVTNSTGIESFTPLAGIPSGFVGDSGLSVRIVYTTTGSTWNWIQYFPNDPETRYGDAITTLQGDVTGLDNNKVAKAGDTMTGALGVTAGSAASPSVFISGDTNTGIYSPGADQLALSTNGAEALRINADGDIQVADGNRMEIDEIRARDAAGLKLFDDAGAGIFIQDGGSVGIGTSAPATQLDVRGALNTGGYAFMTGDANINGAPLGRFGFYNTNASASANPLRAYITSTRENSAWGADLQFFTSQGTNAATSKLVINESGQVGIATQSPVDTVTIQKDTTSAAFGGLTLNTADSNASVLTIGVSSSLDSASIASLRTGTGTVRPLTFIVGTNSANERMRIDSSGRLLVGTSSTSVNTKFILQGGISTNSANMYLARSDAPGNEEPLGFVIFSDNNHGDAAYIHCHRDGGTWNTNTSRPTRLVFSTTADGASSPTERMRITSNGDFLFQGSSTLVSTGFLSSPGETGSTPVKKFIIGELGKAGISYPGQWSFHTSSGWAGSVFKEGFRLHLRNYDIGSATESADLFRFDGNGGLANFSAFNTNLSDINAKKDVTSAASTWDCLKQWEIVNYRYKTQEDTDCINIGVIAQQVSESCPEVVTVFQAAQEETNSQPALDELLGIKEQQMYWMAIKALQEAMERIETLEASNTDLLARVSALESA
ncbi:tail fiber protein [Synechococcus phage DSL-LC07]|nr:tail fiber protein [Synechococcus phage DSL-LC07]